MESKVKDLNCSVSIRNERVDNGDMIVERLIPPN